MCDERREKARSIPAFKQNKMAWNQSHISTRNNERRGVHALKSLSVYNTDLHLSYSNKEWGTELNCVGSDELGSRWMRLYGWAGIIGCMDCEMKMSHPYQEATGCVGVIKAGMQEEIMTRT